MGYQSLEPHIRSLARLQYRLWRKDPFHPSPHFKKMADDTWSVRIGRNHPALAAQVGDTLVWFWIGSHDNYERPAIQTLEYAIMTITDS
jgi:hypothetical protein